MDVRVILQLAAPGVQHPQEAGQLAADEAWIGGEFGIAPAEASNSP